MLQLCTQTGEILVLNKLRSNILIPYSKLHAFLCVVLLLVVQMQTDVYITCIHLVVQGFVNMYVAMKEPSQHKLSPSQVFWDVRQLQRAKILKNLKNYSPNDRASHRSRYETSATPTSEIHLTKEVCQLTTELQLSVPGLVLRGYTSATCSYSVVKVRLKSSRI